MHVNALVFLKSNTRKCSVLGRAKVKLLTTYTETKRNKHVEQGRGAACTYAALILADDDIAITSEKLQTLLKAANVTVEPYWPGLFAKALESTDIKSLLSSVGSSVGAAPAAAAPAAAAEAPVEKKEEKNEEPEESDDDMGFGLFD
ncbi:60S acidic ribosomal protein P1-like [Pollicipes pollicipes]|uniref:60S acidic ribosomal protein P1-like n=1 Tax=Pollicipes pollicipes TaxID=41117 RepID=UPI001884EAB7|nr:60S acidic ribosomal protein P1-like [Pollicipes pollicipes]